MFNYLLSLVIFSCIVSAPLELIESKSKNCQDISVEFETEDQHELTVPNGCIVDVSAEPVCNQDEFPKTCTIKLVDVVSLLMNPTEEEPIGEGGPQDLMAMSLKDESYLDTAFDESLKNDSVSNIFTRRWRGVTCGKKCGSGWWRWACVPCCCNCRGWVQFGLLCYEPLENKCHAACNQGSGSMADFCNTRGKIPFTKWACNAAKDAGRDSCNIFCATFS